MKQKKTSPNKSVWIHSFKCHHPIGSIFDFQCYIKRRWEKNTHTQTQNADSQILIDVRTKLNQQYRVHLIGVILMDLSIVFKLCWFWICFSCSNFFLHGHNLVTICLQLLNHCTSFFQMNDCATISASLLASSNNHIPSPTIVSVCFYFVIRLFSSLFSSTVFCCMWFWIRVILSSDTIKSECILFSQMPLHCFGQIEFPRFIQKQRKNNDWLMQKRNFWHQKYNRKTWI